MWFGATPVFVDIHEDTFNMDARSLQAAIDTAKSIGLRPAGVISVVTVILTVAGGVAIWLVDRAGIVRDMWVDVKTLEKRLAAIFARRAARR